MLSPKTSLVLANAGAFDDEARGTWLPIMVGSKLYASAPRNFPDVDARLAAVEPSSLRAKQLNETLKLIDAIGPIDAGQNSNQGVYYTIENRDGLIEYALAVLYQNDLQPTVFTGGGLQPNEAVI